MKTTLIAVHRAKDNYKQRILGENWEESYRGNERANQGLPRFCLAGVVVICLSFCISVCLFLYLSLITFVRCVYFWIFAISSVFISFLTCQNIFLFSLSIPPPTDPELERLKRENGSHKDVEKCEGRFKKAKEEYKMFVEKYAIVREDFNRKMGESSLRFQG